MKIIGFSSGAAGRQSNVDRMVKAILDKSGHESEFVKLSELTYAGCQQCSQLCAEPQVCMLEDDLLPYYQKLKDADAVVLGFPVIGNAMNATMYAFVERFFGYRHVTFAVRDKPFVVISTGAMRTEDALESLTSRLSRAFRANVIETVEYKSTIFPCYSCGRHKECRIGGFYRVHGEESHKIDVTPEFFKVWEENPETVRAVASAVEKLKTM